MKEPENRNPSIPPYTWLLSRWPNFMASFTQSLRQEAVEHLQLKNGDRVLDVGCGTGMSFPYLVNAVGDRGEVVGVEISPDIAAQARKRVEHHGWSNVHILVDAAQTVKLSSARTAVLLNPLLGEITRHLLPSSSAPIDEHPWRWLEERIGTLHKEERLHGFFYLVWGSLPLT